MCLSNKPDLDSDGYDMVNKHGVGPGQTWLEFGSNTCQVCALSSHWTCLSCGFPFCEMGIIVPHNPAVRDPWMGLCL